jgi:hypothetical protein
VATNAIAAASKGDRGKYNKQAKSFHKPRLYQYAPPNAPYFLRVCLYLPKRQLNAMLYYGGESVVIL